MRCSRYRDDGRDEPGEIMARVDSLPAATPAFCLAVRRQSGLQPRAADRARRRNGHSFARKPGQHFPTLVRRTRLADSQPEGAVRGHDDDCDALEACSSSKSQPRCVLKIVVFDDADYSYAHALAAHYPRCRLLQWAIPRR